MISERTLKQWRRDALRLIEKGPIEGTIDATLTYNSSRGMSERILRLTQELMDLHLIKKGV